MVCRRLTCVAPIAAVLAVLFVAVPVHAIGYWNIPGNFCQSTGYGWGAGHHACLVLGPITCDDCCAHHEVRLPHAPQPPYASYGCDAYNYDFRQPTQVAPVEYQSTPQVVEPIPEMASPSLTPDPLPIPEPPVPSRPIFEPPVEQ